MAPGSCIRRQLHSEGLDPCCTKALFHSHHISGSRASLLLGTPAARRNNQHTHNAVPWNMEACMLCIRSFTAAQSSSCVSKKAVPAPKQSRNLESSGLVSEAFYAWLKADERTTQTATAGCRELAIRDVQRRASSHQVVQLSPGHRIGRVHYQWHGGRGRTVSTSLLGLINATRLMVQRAKPFRERWS